MSLDQEQASVHVLFLNPYHAGSHRDFVEQWAAHSRHTFTLKALAGHHWKWRMRHGAWSLAEACRDLDVQPDIVVATDMLDLALWKASCPQALRAVPHVLYFHENQLTYPDQHKRGEDLHFAVTNIFSAALADEVWFNSRYHKDSFFAAAEGLSRRMPTPALTTALAAARENVRVEAPGVVHQVCTEEGDSLSSQTLRVVWVARWDWDKGCDQLLALMTTLRDENIEWVVLGAKLSDAVRASLREVSGARLVYAGYAESPAAYHRWLASAHVVLSTARHEFFGIGVVEAALHGCVPLVPRGLAYPEVLDGSSAQYYESLDEAEGVLRSMSRNGFPFPRGKLDAMQRHRWKARAPALDHKLLELGRERPA